MQHCLAKSQHLLTNPFLVHRFYLVVFLMLKLLLLLKLVISEEVSYKLLSPADTVVIIALMIVLPTQDEESRECFMDILLFLVILRVAHEH